MAWTILRATPADNAAGILQIFTWLESIGFVAECSGDGVNATLATDGSLFDPTVELSHISYVLEDVFAISFQSAGTVSSNSEARIKFAYGTGCSFLSGATGTQVGSHASEYVRRGGGTDASPTYALWSEHAGGSVVYFFTKDPDTDTFLIGGMQNFGGHSLAFCFRHEVLLQPHPTDTLPTIANWVCEIVPFSPTPADGRYGAFSIGDETSTINDTCPVGVLPDGTTGQIPALAFGDNYIFFEGTGSFEYDLRNILPANEAYIGDLLFADAGYVLVGMPIAYGAYETGLIKGFSRFLYWSSAFTDDNQHLLTIDAVPGAGIAIYNMIIANWDNDYVVAGGSATATARLISMGSGGGSSDTDAPAVANLDPPNNTELERLQFVEFDLSDASDLALVTILLAYSYDPDNRVVVYDEGQFWGVFATHSEVTGSGTEGDPYHFRIRPTNGWPTGTSVNMLPRFVDDAGNVQEGPV